MRFRAAIIVLGLVACAPRGELVVDPEAIGVGTIESIYVGTTRTRDPSTDSFGDGRSNTTTFARYDISVPPTHVPGNIEWAGKGRKPDPATDFVALEEVIHPGPAAFRKDLSDAMRAQEARSGEVVIFIHGFNTTFVEGLYRIGQLSHDLNTLGAVVHYSWPSAGKPLGYVTDWNSATFARDGLEELIHQTIDAGATSILLVAHSMGSALTMETLLQMSQKGDARTLGRLAGLVMISPDIDVDVFLKQAADISRLPDPFIIFGSTKDRALNLSARLTGQTERLGSIRDITRLSGVKLTYLDTSAFSTRGGHFNLGNSPALLALVSQIDDVNEAFDDDPAGKPGLLPGMVLSVRNATEVVLSPLAVMFGQ